MANYVSKYNTVTGEWERVPEDWELQYIPQTGTWKFAPPNATSQYNTVTGEFSPREGDVRPVYNPPQGDFELGNTEQRWVDVYNPVTGKFEMRPIDEDDQEDSDGRE